MEEEHWSKKISRRLWCMCKEAEEGCIEDVVHEIQKIWFLEEERRINKVKKNMKKVQQTNEKTNKQKYICFAN